MADYLAYWKTFWDEDEKWCGPERARSHSCKKGFGSAQKDILRKIDKGETLWIVGRSEDGAEWRLLQRLRIKKKYPEGGKLRVVANRQASGFFDPGSQADFEKELQKLEFTGSGPIVSKGKRIGLHLRRIRQLTALDVGRLRKYARRLKSL